VKHSFYALIALCLCRTIHLSADVGNFSDGPLCSNIESDCCEIACCPDWSLEFRIAAFLTTNKEVRQIYSSAWADYQVQIGKRIWNDWQIFAEFSGSQKLGHSFLGDKTKLRVFPITLGAKYFFNLYPCLDAYIGGGVAYSFLRIRDESPYVHHHTSKGQFGGVIKTGLIYTFCNCWFVDVFADYLFQRFSFHGVSCDPYVTRHTANLSGFKIGGGIGFNF
jgi:hypothetical protein